MRPAACCPAGNARQTRPGPPEPRQHLGKYCVTVRSTSRMSPATHAGPPSVTSGGARMGSSADHIAAARVRRIGETPPTSWSAVSVVVPVGERRSPKMIETGGGRVAQKREQNHGKPLSVKSFLRSSDGLRTSGSGVRITRARLFFGLSQQPCARPVRGGCGAPSGARMSIGGARPTAAPVGVGAPARDASSGGTSIVLCPNDARAIQSLNQNRHATPPRSEESRSGRRRRLAG